MTDPMDQPVTRREQQATFDAFLPVLMDHISKQLTDRFEDFGQQMATSFAHVHERFEQVDKRFEQVDKRFDEARTEMDKRFDDARIQMVAVVDHMGDTLREEMRELSKTDLQTMRDDLASFDEKYQDLPRRVRRLEKAVFKPDPAKRGRTR